MPDQDTAQTKRCTRCGEVKDLTTSFFQIGGAKRSQGDGYRPHCKSCHQAARRYIPSVCQQCGKDFFARPDGYRAYCGTPCSEQAMRQAEAASRITVACPICGTIRKVFPSVLAKGKGKYCSWACGRIGVRTHGELAAVSQRSPEYAAWMSIKARCLNPTSANYPRYGGRGITVCDRWRDSFEAFLADMGRRPGPGYSIDRIDNERGNYEPGACRWATATEQTRNRRTNRLVTFSGETHCVAEWAQITGLSTVCLTHRLNMGWSVERTLTAPARVTKARTPRHT